MFTITFTACLRTFTKIFSPNNNNNSDDTLASSIDKFIEVIKSTWTKVIGSAFTTRD